MIVSALVGALAGIVDCGASDTCLRYSDCDDGYTCASGLCVVAPVESGDGGDNDGGETSSVDDAAATTTDAAVVLIDAMTSTTTTTSASDAGDAGEASDASRDDAVDSSAIVDASTD